MGGLAHKLLSIYLKGMLARSEKGTIVFVLAAINRERDSEEERNEMHKHKHKNKHQQQRNATGVQWSIE